MVCIWGSVSCSVSLPLMLPAGEWHMTTATEVARRRSSRKWGRDKARGRPSVTVKEWAIKWTKEKYLLCPLLILCHLQIIQHQSWTMGDLSPCHFPVLSLINPTGWALRPLHISSTHLAVCFCAQACVRVWCAGKPCACSLWHEVLKIFLDTLHRCSLRGRNLVCPMVTARLRRGICPFYSWMFQRGVTALWLIADLHRHTCHLPTTE